VNEAGLGSPKGGWMRLYYRRWTELFYQTDSEGNATKNTNLTSDNTNTLLHIISLEHYVPTSDLIVSLKERREYDAAGVWGITLIHIGRASWVCAADTCSSSLPACLAIDSSSPARHFGRHSFESTQTELNLRPVQLK